MTKKHGHIIRYEILKSKQETLRHTDNINAIGGLDPYTIGTKWYQNIGWHIEKMGLNHNSWPMIRHKEI